MAIDNLWKLLGPLRAVTREILKGGLEGSFWSGF
jgi:hypothetical protein